jgi:ribose transport system substrate-binding protein
MILAILVLIASLVASCASPATQAPAETQAPAATQPPAAGETQAPAPEEGAAGPFTIGVSNSFVGSEYRTQMIDVLEQVNAEFKEQGLTNDLVIESATTDVAGQIQQIQNLINRGVDAIIVNPGDVEGLNATLSEAVNQGIVVIAIDQEIGAEGVYNVAINQNEWAKTSAQWFAEKLGGEGDVVLIEGFVGHPANVARMSGVEEVLGQYPGINVVGRESGMWDEATGQQVMSNFLASFPNLDGYWTQDGMAIGAFQALQAANPEDWPVVVGEGRVRFLKLWQETLETRPDFETIAVANPPGVAGSGLRIAVELLQGRQIDPSKLEGEWGNTLYMPIPVVVTKDNFEQVYEEYKDLPDSYLLDGILSQEEVQQFFQN